MRIVKLTLLNHLFYYTEVTGGSTGATLTGGFLGDLALTYAFASAFRNRENMYEHRLRPEYEEINTFGYYCTVGRPLVAVKRTNAFIQNTLFTDGYPDVESIKKSGSSPYKNYRQTQGISIGNEFLAIFFAKENVELPPVIRVGRQRESLLKVEIYDQFQANKEDNNFWLNAFSLKTIFGNLDQVVSLMAADQQIQLWKIIESYFLIQNLKLEQVQRVFAQQFPSI